MNRINVESTNINSNDVIATSSCNGKYHFMVTHTDIYGIESGYLALFTNADAFEGTFIRDGRPNDLPLKAGEYTEYGDLYVDVGDVSSLGPVILFHWNGKKWVECGTRHYEAYMKSQG